MILQPGAGPIRSDHYLPSEPDTVSWGVIPTASTPSVLSIAADSTVTIDTMSHEGILDEFDRDPIGWFGRHGVDRDAVLDDAARIARDVPRPDGAGPHVLTGPIDVDGANPGDVLVVEVLDLSRRVPYGVISNRHEKGVLPEFPTPHADGSHQTMSVFTEVHEPEDREAFAEIGWSGAAGDRAARFPLQPFLGVMGVAIDDDRLQSSTPPGDWGGNIDVKWLQSGARVYLPVQIPGAGFYVGDPHFAQGNGEVCLTALEGSLRSDLRISVLTGAEARALGGLLASPLVETDAHWIPIGLDEDLDLALQRAVRNAVAFLGERVGMPAHLAYAYLSAAADFEISQAVNTVKGVHCKIRKSDFE
jgi:acetamidase/formamidase